MPQQFGNLDCPECGGYGWVVPESAPPGSYEHAPCTDCCCPVCHAHVAAGEICEPLCDRRMRDEEKAFDAFMLVREWRRDARAVA